MLSILPIDLIKVAKTAAIEDGLKLSGAVIAGEAEIAPTA